MSTTITERVQAAVESIESRALYPVPEARQILGGIGTTTLYELFKTHQLERVNIERRAFVTAKSLVAYLNWLSSGDAGDAGGGGDDAA